MSIAPAGEGDAKGTSGARFLPEWRFYTEASPFARPEIGLYRRIKDRWDCGLQISGRFSASEDEDEHSLSRTEGSLDEFGYLRLNEETIDRFDLDLRTGIRKWNRSSDRLSLFRGLRFTLSYRNRVDEWLSRRSEDPDHGDYDSIDSYKGESTEFGLALSPSVGIDVHLLEHISAAVAIVPVDLGVIWRDGESYRDYRDSDDTGEALDMAESKSESTETYLKWDIRPQIYLSVNW